MHNQHLKPGYAIFHGNGGYPLERKQASLTFENGKSYRVIGGTEYGWDTRLEFDGICGRWNSVMFDYDIDTLPVGRMFE